MTEAKFRGIRTRLQKAAYPGVLVILGHAPAVRVGIAWSFMTSVLLASAALSCHSRAWATTSPFLVQHPKVGLGRF
jgi:hypothetical protein